MYIKWMAIDFGHFDNMFDKTEPTDNLINLYTFLDDFRWIALSVNSLRNSCRNLLIWVEY